MHTARTEGYSKLMLGDNCTRLAVKLLTSISLGRGAQLAQDTVRRDDEQREREQHCIYCKAGWEERHATSSLDLQNALFPFLFSFIGHQMMIKL